MICCATPPRAFVGTAQNDVFWHAHICKNMTNTAQFRVAGMLLVKRGVFHNQQVYI